jgi:hypothetical protein
MAGEPSPLDQSAPALLPSSPDRGAAATPPDLFPIPALILAASAFAVVVPFFFLGNASGHDFEFHVFSWMEVVYQWKEGILFPRWASFAHWTYGEARFLFYPPTSWNLGAFLGLLMPWKMVSGAYIWISLTASGCSMFLLARRWLGRSDAIFASALYAANPYHLVIVYWRSALAELLAAALLPLLLLLVLRSDEEGPRLILPLSLVVAAAWLTNAPAAVMVNYSLALLVVVVAVARHNRHLLLYGAAAVALGAALAAFYLVPAAYEEKWVNLGEVLAPGVRPLDNFLFTNTQDADHNRFNLLVSIVATAEILVLAAAIYLARKWREQELLAFKTLTAWAAAAALLMCPFTFIFWEYLPKLRFVQLPWRWQLGLNVALAILVTVGIRSWLRRVLLCAAMLLLLWMVGHRVQQPWWDQAADIQEMQDAFEDGGGYEGTDEYVPAGVDPYELNKDTPQVAVASGRPAHIRILDWSAQSKRFTAEVARPEKLRLRLFNYPAWRVEVNGVPIEAKAQPVTGQILVPVETGISEVRTKFIQTKDRFWGGMISLLAWLLVALWVAYQRRPFKFRLTQIRSPS